MRRCFGIRDFTEVTVENTGEMTCSRLCCDIVFSLTLPDLSSRTSAGSGLAITAITVEAHGTQPVFARSTAKQASY